MNQYKLIKDELRSLRNPERAVHSLGYFKTGKGEYGEGDQFYGVSVPHQRQVARQYWKQAGHSDLERLLDSSWHEERLTGIFMLVLKFNEAFKKGGGKGWVDLYLSKTDRVNNWDLVDSSAHLILGRWLEDKDRKILYKFAKSKMLWENRIAVIATMHFIRNDEYDDTVALCEILLNHPHDLIHKATGWMLREIWQRDPMFTESFLDKHRKQMPRTMLRYAIEKMPPAKRKHYMGS
jgi:3-methyladenine DNA glycosylase AlkD